MDNAEVKLTPIWLRWIKWTIVLLTCVFLLYKLYAFGNYADFLNSFENISAISLFALVLTVLLMPLNIFLEAKKWQILLSDIQQISIVQSFKSVLSGFSAGSFTPNRLGDFVGRALFVDRENRKLIPFFSAINAVTMNLVIACIGVPAFLYLIIFEQSDLIFSSGNYLYLLLLLVVITIVLFIFKDTILKAKITNRLFPFLNQQDGWNAINWFNVLLFTLLRLLVFSFQFFLVLQFFNVHLYFSEALIAIPSTYLLVTFLPSFLFTEAFVRSSSAVLIIGIYNSNIAGIAMAGFFIWIINYALPMMLGVKILAGKE